MVYTALTISSRYMMITYPMADFEGKSLRPSIIIPRLKRVMKPLKKKVNYLIISIGISIENNNTYSNF